MNRSLIRAAVAAAALALAACGGDKPGSGGAPADSTQPAPGPQTNAAPQLDTTGVPPLPPEPPVVNRDTVHRMGPGQTYASCMARARAGNPDERVLLESTCKQLPDAPR
jgi:hypothetical protein